MSEVNADFNSPFYMIGLEVARASFSLSPLGCLPILGSETAAFPVRAKVKIGYDGVRCTLLVAEVSLAGVGSNDERAASKISSSASAGLREGTRRLVSPRKPTFVCNGQNRYILLG